MTVGIRERRCHAAFGPARVTFGMALFMLSLFLKPAWGQLFVVAPEYAAGHSPQAIAVGDFNGDGKDDLAVASFGDSILSVLLGNGDGTFQPSVGYGTGNGAGGVVVGDFNGDSKPDLAVANPVDNTMSVLLGNGDGTFQARVDYATGRAPRLPAVADFNGDGNADLVVADVLAHAVTVLLGNDDGTFRSHVEYSTEPFIVRSVAAGDLDGDGKPDLAVTLTHPQDSCISGVGILLGNGDGTFRAPVFYQTGCSTWQIVIEDFNRDLHKDLAVVNTGNTVSILFGNGDGTFRRDQDYATGQNPVAITTGDFDSDGHPDLAVTNFTGSVSVLLGNGDGTFQARQDYGTGQGPSSVAIGHFHGDTQLDMATANNGYCVENVCPGASVSILLGEGGGAFATSRDYIALSDVNAIAVGDVNGDGSPDLAVSNTDTFPSGPFVSIILGRGDGTFPAPVNYLAGSFPVALALADFNGDQKLDLVAVGDTPDAGLLSIFLGKGDGTFQTRVDYPISSPEPLVTSIAVADFDGDGKMDIAVPGAGSGHTEIAVLLGNGDGSFHAEVDYPSEFDCALVVGDFNGEGVPDLAASTCASNLVSVLLGNGDGTFQSHRDFSVLGQTFTLAVADLNGDGKQDLIVGNAASNDLGWVSVLLGNGDGTFQTHRDYETEYFPVSLAVADFDGDGNLDVAETDFAAGGSVFLGNGDGTLQTRTQYPTGSMGPLVSTDLNQDRKPDLVVAHGQTGTVSVLLNSVIGPFFRLSVATGVVGRGTLTVVPGGTHCTSSCSEDFASGTALTLSATPNAGFRFTGWSGGGCSGTGACNLTMTSDKAVTAIFDLTPDFAISLAALTPDTVNPGRSASSTIDVTAVAGFNSSVAFTCSVSPKPQLAPPCSISPGSVTPGTPATLTVTTTAPQAAMASPRGRSELFYALWIPLFGLTLMRMVSPSKRREPIRQGACSCVLLVATLLLLSACGGNNDGSRGSPGTPAGTYTITVTGTSGTAHSTTVTLTVQ